MDIVGMIKKDTIIRSKPTLDNTWQTGEIKAGTGVKITALVSMEYTPSI
jgi:hypothetical protein